MKEKEYEQIIAKAKLDKEQGELEREWTAVSAMVDSVITPSKEEEKHQVLDSEQEHEKQVEASSNKSKLKVKGNTYQTPSKNGSAVLLSLQGENVLNPLLYSCLLLPWFADSKQQHYQEQNSSPLHNLSLLSPFSNEATPDVASFASSIFSSQSRELSVWFFSRL